MTRVCRVCDQEKDIEKFHRGHGYSSICGACDQIRHRVRLKLELLNAFGRKCQCCGERNPYFLTLDHRVPGNGANATGLNTYQLYRQARADNWDPKKYQLLCMNCNWVIGKYGECPHQRNKTADEIYLEFEALAVPLERNSLSGELISPNTFAGLLSRLKDMSEDQKAELRMVLNNAKTGS